MTEDGIVGWHHQLNGHEFEQAPGVGDGQGSLVCCSTVHRCVSSQGYQSPREEQCSDKKTQTQLRLDITGCHSFV